LGSSLWIGLAQTLAVLGMASPASALLGLERMERLKPPPLIARIVHSDGFKNTLLCPWRWALTVRFGGPHRKAARGKWRSFFAEGIETTLVN